MIVAAVNWKLRPGSTPAQFADHAREVLDRAAGAELAVLPENLTLELLPLDAHESQVPEEIARFEAAYIDCFADLASQGNAVIVAGSTLVRRGDTVVNAAGVFYPDGRVEWQPKVKLTTYERHVWGLSPGAGLSRLSNSMGVLVCYDAEFPEASRALAESGVTALCVPAFTEGLRGYQRVRWCCHARAVENQIFVIHSSLVGSLGREPAATTWGDSAVLCPSIEPFPASAVLASTPLGEESVAIATLDGSMLDMARASGDVRNWIDRDPAPWIVR